MRRTVFYDILLILKTVTYCFYFPPHIAQNFPSEAATALKASFVK